MVARFVICDNRSFLGRRGSRCGLVTLTFQQPSGLFFIPVHAASLRRPLQKQRREQAPRPTVQNLYAINCLSEQGLGGAWELARAKASVGLLLPSIRVLEILFCNFVRALLGRGAGERFFS